MSYSMICEPPMSKVDAAKFGQWLSRYQIQVASMTCWQIDANGKHFRDEPLADTVQTAVSGAAGGAVSGTVGAPLLAPVVALLSPAAVLAMFAAIPALLIAQYQLRKRIPEPVRFGGAEIVATELEFGLAGVSAQRRKWSEYLIAIYAALHQWHDIRGFQHPEQIAGAAAYAARTGGYPPPWSESAAGRVARPRPPAAARRPRRTPAPRKTKPTWRERARQIFEDF